VKISQQQKTVLVDVNWPLSVIDEVSKLAPKHRPDSAAPKE
jgi:hypothetical protein